MKSFALFALALGTAHAEHYAAFGEPPVCEVDGAGMTHVFYSEAKHPSFKCEHLAEPVITTSEELESSSSDSSSPVAIIVGVLVAVLAVCLLCASFFIMRKRQQNKPKHVTLNNPNAGGAAPGGKPTKGYQMAVKEQKDLAPNQA